MSSILEFLWSALRNWSVWVTGTGIVGVLLFLLGLLERRRNRPLAWKTYALVLFSVFWFFGTFAAWHDSQKNLRQVIDQRGADTSSLGVCNADLQTQTALKESWQSRYGDQQKTINSLLAPQLQTQSALNNCVVSLGKANPIISTDIGVTAINAAWQSKSTFLGNDVTFFSVIVVSTNHRMNAEGTLQCAKPFTPESAPTLRLEHSGISGTGNFRKISDSEYYLKNNDTASEWDAVNPLYMVITSKEKSVGPCSFSLAQ